MEDLQDKLLIEADLNDTGSNGFLAGKKKKKKVKKKKDKKVEDDL